MVWHDKWLGELLSTIFRNYYSIMIISGYSSSSSRLCSILLNHLWVQSGSEISATPVNTVNCNVLSALHMPCQLSGMLFANSNAYDGTLYLLLRNCFLLENSTAVMLTIDYSREGAGAPVRGCIMAMVPASARNYWCYGRQLLELQIQSTHLLRW